jgi:hypothetical protein
MAGEIAAAQYGYGSLGLTFPEFDSPFFYAHTWHMSTMAHPWVGDHR